MPSKELEIFADIKAKISEIKNAPGRHDQSEHGSWAQGSGISNNPKFDKLLREFLDTRAKETIGMAKLEEMPGLQDAIDKYGSGLFGLALASRGVDDYKYNVVDSEKFDKMSAGQKTYYISPTSRQTMNFVQYGIINTNMPPGLHLESNIDKYSTPDYARHYINAVTARVTLAPDTKLISYDDLKKLGTEATELYKKELEDELAKETDPAKKTLFEYTMIKKIDEFKQTSHSEEFAIGIGYDGTLSPDGEPIIYNPSKIIIENKVTPILDAETKAKTEEAIKKDHDEYLAKNKKDDAELIKQTNKKYGDKTSVEAFFKKIEKLIDSGDIDDEEYELPPTKEEIEENVAKYPEAQALIASNGHVNFMDNNDKDKRSYIYDAVLQHDYINASKTLTSGQYRALNYYRSDNFSEINDMLRESKDDKELENEQYLEYPIIKAMDEAMSKFTTQRDITVYRGIFDIDKFLERTSDKIFMDKAYTSTSLSPFVANVYTKTVETGFIDSGDPEYVRPEANLKGGILKIEVPKGTHGIYLDELPNSQYAPELELLLARETKFEVDPKVSYLDKDGHETDKAIREDGRPNIKMLSVRVLDNPFNFTRPTHSSEFKNTDEFHKYMTEREKREVAGLKELKNEGLINPKVNVSGKYEKNYYALNTGKLSDIIHEKMPFMEDNGLFTTIYLKHGLKSFDDYALPPGKTGDFSDYTSRDTLDYNLTTLSEFGDLLANKLKEEYKDAGLTKTEKDDVQLYRSDSGYPKINGLLRGKTNDSQVGGKDIQKVISDIDSAISKTKTPCDLALYRGTDAYKDIFGDKPVESLVGTIFTDKGFISTSTDEMATSVFAMPHESPQPISLDGTMTSYTQNIIEKQKTTDYSNWLTIKIKLPKGSNGFFMPVFDKGISNLNFEQEVLLPRNTSFKVVLADKRPVDNSGGKPVNYIEVEPVNNLLSEVKKQISSILNKQYQ